MIKAQYKCKVTEDIQYVTLEDLIEALNQKVAEKKVALDQAGKKNSKTFRSLFSKMKKKIKSLFENDV